MWSIESQLISGWLFIIVIIELECLWIDLYSRWVELSSIYWVHKGALVFGG